MKAENAVRLSDNLVGFEVYTIQDVVKAQAAGLELINKDGIGYDYSVVIEDEDGENAARRLYDLGCLENGELDSVSFEVEEEGK